MSLSVTEATEQAGAGAGGSSADATQSTEAAIEQQPTASSPSSNDTSSSNSDVVLRAVVKIQSMVRGMRARQQARRHALLVSWSRLENKQESELVHTYPKYTELKATFADRFRAVQESKLPAIHGDTPVIIENDMYKTPRVPPPGELTLDFVTAMMDHFKNGHLLYYEDVLQVLDSTREVLQALPNVVHIPMHTRLTIVGDLHGQLDDLFSIFKLNGLPSLRNSYLFNGDFVDRGQYSIEIVMVLFCFKLLFPDNVFLNRGNHEARDINSRDGFEKECLRKYDMAMFDAFSSTFAHLPLAHMLKDKVFVVHGGLTWEDITIDQLQEANRVFEIPESNSICEQVLWSDPRHKRGREDNPRGASLVFGPDVTEKFLEDNKVDLIIRSHEVKDEGYDFSHDGKVITVFSASNYCGVVGNKGALIVFQPDMGFEIVQFEAKPMRSISRYRMRYAQLENDTISQLLRRIAQCRLGLVDYFRKIEVDGGITRVQWADGLRTVLGVDIPFLEFQGYLGLPKLGVRGTANSPVDYMAFLDRYRLKTYSTPESDGKVGHNDANEAHSAMDRLISLLLSQQYELESLFRYLDANGDGKISVAEFTEGLRSLCALLEKPFTDNEIAELLALIDTNQDNVIEYDEFFSSFRLADDQLASLQDAGDKHRDSLRPKIEKAPTETRRSPRLQQKQAQQQET
jgi:diadenosine tetraphosphatase ApaH/serine/threonine PP2A family protein phosphatase